jgi:hypothetical protein
MVHCPRCNSTANDPHTLPFYQVYRDDLDPGNDAEFAYLQETQPEAGQDAEMASDDEDARGVVTQKELAESLRELARQEHVEVSYLRMGKYCQLKHDSRK